MKTFAGLLAYFVIIVPLASWFGRGIAREDQRLEEAIQRIKNWRDGK